MASNSPVYLRVVQTAAWMWMVYLVSLAIMDTFIYGGGPVAPILEYHLFNGLPAVVFFALSYSKWSKNPGRFLTSFMVLLISAVPILINDLLGLRLPPAPLANLEGMILRQLPVLFIALVLVAWHYKLTAIILFSIGLNVFELLIVFNLRRLDVSGLTAFYFITIIRMVCFIVVGVFINQLINLLRAQQESLKMANYQLTHYVSTLESLTVSRERNRMSRELHDTVVHTLSGLSVQLETIKAYWNIDSETARNLLGQSLETTRTGLHETRRALKELRASPLEDLGLVIALKKLIDTAAERGKLLLDVTLPDKDVVLSPDVEQCIYRITQEAVENVVHHASAQHLAVNLTIKEGEIILVIQDDGIGFSHEIKSPAGHFGLDGMRERAQLAGGVLTITSKPSSGTIIQLVIKGSFK